LLIGLNLRGAESKSYDQLKNVRQPLKIEKSKMITGTEPKYIDVNIFLIEQDRN